MSTEIISGRSAGSRRFWITVLCFLTLNILAWIVYDRTFAAWHRGVLRVASFAPGDNATVDARPTLHWYFSDDVLPTAAYGKDPGKTSPAVAGKWAWENPRTLSFVPTADLPQATPVVFTLSTDLLRTGTGAAMKQPFVSTVHCKPLAVEVVRQSASIENDQFVLDLKFNDRVAPGDVLLHVTATLPNGRHVDCHLYGQSAGKTVRLVTDSVPLENSEAETILNVKLSRGLTGFSGPLGLDAPYETNFSLGKKLMATQLSGCATVREGTYLILSFNSEVDLSLLKKVLSVEPAVPYTLESDGGQAAMLRGNFLPGTRYTVRLAAPDANATKQEKAHTPRAGHLSAFVPDMGSGVWFENDQGYLSTAGNRTVVAHAMNVNSIHVSITRMYDNNLVAWRNGSNGSQNYYAENYSKPVAEKKLKVPGGKNIRRDIPICLGDFLPADAERAGVWRVGVSSADNETSEEDRDDDRESAVVTLSDIGLTAKQTREGLVAWATSLRTGTPLSQVKVRAFSSKNQPLGEAITDNDGIARLANLHPTKDEIVAVLLAEKLAPFATTGPTVEYREREVGNELTWLDLRRTNWELGDSDISGTGYLRNGQSAYVYTDRGVYRPGETLHLRAILRSPGQIAPQHAFPVKWLLRRPDLRDWKSETVMLDADGSAGADIALPNDLPSGMWTASIGLPGDEKKNPAFGNATFLIEDFVPNRLKVSLEYRNQNDKDLKRYTISDEPLDVQVQGDYLFGRPGSGLTVDLSTHAVHTAFQPTGWDGWTFGDAANIATVAKPTTATPNVMPPKRHKKSAPAGNVALVADEQEPETSVLDEHGRYRSSLSVAEIVHLPEDLSNVDAYRGPWMLSTSAGVHETGGRAVTVSRQIAVDALPAYIGVRRVDGSAVAKPGEASDFQVRLVKPDGAPANMTDAKLQVQLLKETWNTSLAFRDGRYHYDSTRSLNVVNKQTIQISQGAGIFAADVPESGLFVIRLTDPATGATTTSAFYATNGSGWDENVDRENPERLAVRILGVGESEDADETKKPEHTTWHIGDTARVLIASPFKGQLLLSIETDDVVQTQVVEMTSTHMVVPVKVTDACWPNAYVSATAVRPVDPNAKWATHRAYGVANLNVDSTDRRLQMTIAAPELIRPLQSLDVAVKVTDPDGKVVGNAAITLAAVDEGICSVTDFKTPDPLKFFSSKKALGVQSGDIFGLLMPEVAKPDGQRAVGGDRPESSSSRYRSPVTAHRVKLVALAWETVHSDADGIARASFSLPQFQGRLRIIAVGYTTKLLGSADRGVTVRSPILAQSSWPRFAAPGDQFTVPIVLFNNTEIGGDATVTAQLLNDERTPAGLLNFTGKLPSVALTGGGQQQINLNVTVAQATGVAKVRLHVAMGEETFEEDVELPVRPASPMTQFGGVFAASTTQPTSLPAMTAMMPGTDSLRISVTPWPTLNLPQGLDYLDRYPYGCVEQTTSTLFPLIALGDIGTQMDPDRFDPERVKAKIDAGILHLIGMQTADGGLAMWSGGSQPWPWASVYAAHFLTEAKTAGYLVPTEFYEQLMAYVWHLMDKGTDDATQVETQSYASYVLALVGRPDRALLNRLTELTAARQESSFEVEAMRNSARMMLSCAWLLSGRRDLAESLLPSAMPQPRHDRQMDGNLGSPIRDRAMVILAFEQVEPNRPELPSLVQQLADAGVKNEWSCTHDIAFSMLAIGHYLRDQKQRLPYESARLLMGETVLAEASSHESIAWSAEGSQLRSLQSLKLQLTGATDAVGHLSWVQTGVPMSPPKDAEHGLKIHRTYQSMDRKELNGSVRTGDLVRVELTIEGPPNEPNLVIEDLLPAGLEVENPRLETSAKVEDDAESKLPSFGDGRVDMLDDRVIICGQMPRAWKAHCSYLARAITPGSYVVPPVRCEAMYDLNVNAMSGAGRLVVTPVVKDMAAAE